MIITKHVIAFYVNEVENLSYAHKDFVTHREFDNQPKIMLFLSEPENISAKQNFQSAIC